MSPDAIPGYTEFINHKLLEAAERIQTSDGFTFYKTDTGIWVDHLDPDHVDMSFTTAGIAGQISSGRIGLSKVDDALYEQAFAQRNVSMKMRHLFHRIRLVSFPSHPAWVC